MKNQAFTLIEILTVITVFFIILGAISGIFVWAIKSQKVILASQELLNQTGYSVEYISRALRMAKKDLGPDCLSIKGWNYEIIGGGDEGSGIRFINHLEDDECQEIFLSAGKLQRKKVKPPSETFDLTSDKIKIIDFKFRLSGKGQDDTVQPRVVLLLEAQTIDGEKIKIQTTLSQRDLDIVK